MKTAIQLSAALIVIATALFVFSCSKSNDLPPQLNALTNQATSLDTEVVNAFEGKTELGCFVGCGFEDNSCDCNLFENCDYEVTVTGITNNIRVLFFKPGSQTPPQCGDEITADGIYARTFDTKVWEEGEYIFHTGPQHEVKLQNTSTPFQTTPVTIQITGSSNCGGEGVIGKMIILDLNNSTQQYNSSEKFCLEIKDFGDEPSGN